MVRTGRREGLRGRGGRGERWGRDRLGVTDGQTLKNHRLSNFSDGERRACECVRYGAIDRAIGRAKGVVLRLEKIIIDTERK